MLSAHDIFIAYEAELNALELKYGDYESKEYFSDKGCLHRKYAQIYRENGYLDRCLAQLSHAANNFRNAVKVAQDLDIIPSEYSNALADTQLQRAQIAESQGADAQFLYELAAKHAPEEKKPYYQAQLKAYLKRRGLTP